jgi:hypothetical protein
VVRGLAGIAVLAAGALGYVVYDRYEVVQQAAGSSAPSVIAARPSAPPSTTAPPAAAPAPADPAPGASPPRVTGARLFRLAPQACAVVSPTTQERLVPSATIARFGGSTASTCDYSGKAGSRYRELRVETQIFAPPVSHDPVDDAKVAIDNRLTDAQEDPVVRTVDIEPVSGLGDEAYQRFAADKGQPTVVGEVVVRVRNSLAAVTYVEEAPADDAAGEEIKRRCIAEARAVAQEILRAFE